MSEFSGERVQASSSNTATTGIKATTKDQFCNNWIGAGDPSNDSYNMSAIIGEGLKGKATCRVYKDGVKIGKKEVIDLALLSGVNGWFSVQLNQPSDEWEEVTEDLQYRFKTTATSTAGLELRVDVDCSNAPASAKFQAGPQEIVSGRGGFKDVVYLDNQSDPAAALCEDL